MAQLTIKEKSSFKFWFDDYVKTEENFKLLVRDLYVSYGYSYVNIKSIVRHNYRETDTIEVIEILKEFDVKRCSQGEDCKCPDGCVQSRDNFWDYKNSNDGKQPVCTYCQKFNKINQTKQKHILEFQKIKELDKQDEFLVDLYKKEDYTYNDLAAISLRYINDVINLLEIYDIKRCYRGENCKSPDGCVQSLDNFPNNKNENDGKNSQCVYCQRFVGNFKRANQTKQNYMLEFQEIKELDKQDEFLVEIYKNEEYTYNDLVAISLTYNMDDIINLFKKHDIKKCSSEENCKSPDGCMQSLDNFADNKSLSDGKSNQCVYCQRFNHNFKNANQTKQNHMLEFQKIKDLDKQDDFLIILYKKEDYTYNDLAAISLRNDINYIVFLLKKHDIKKCSSGKDCKSPDGYVQSQDNFNNNKNFNDGKSMYCIYCHQSYHIQPGKYNTYASQIETYEDVRRDPNNSELIQVKCKYNGCNEWFNPTNMQITDRIRAINGKGSIGAENHLYCSDNCKEKCPLYNLRSDSSSNNERMQPQLRQYLLKMRNPDRCEGCGKKLDQKDLILHHKIPVADNYMLEADLDNLIFLCPICHAKAHQKDGCQLGQLREYKAC